MRLSSYWSKHIPGREGEVDEGELRGNFRTVMRVWQVGGDVELEILVVRDHRIPQLQHCVALLFVGLCQRDKGRRAGTPTSCEVTSSCPGLCGEERARRDGQRSSKVPGRPEHLNLYSTFHGPDCQAQTKCLLAGDWAVREAAKTYEH